MSYYPALSVHSNDARTPDVPIDIVQIHLRAEEMARMHDLPAEVVGIIFSYLHCKTHQHSQHLATVARVCSLWHDIAFNQYLGTFRVEVLRTSARARMVWESCVLHPVCAMKERCE